MKQDYSLRLWGATLLAAACLGCNTSPPGASPGSNGPRRGAAAAPESPRAGQTGSADPRSESPPQGTRLTGSPQAEQGAPSADAPLIPDWPKPQAALFLTGRQNGYIEPCGCTGLANQKGGLARRQTLLKKLTETGWPVAALDVGNQERRFGRQPEIKFQMTVEALGKMKYDAVGFGPDDLKISFGELASTVADERSPFVSANVNLLDLTPTHRVIEVGGKKLGVTAILGAEAQKQIAAEEITIVTAEEGLEKVVPELEAQGCDYYVLLAHATTAESEALARKFPLFHLVISASGSGEPEREARPIEGAKARLVQIGEKSMYVGIVGLYDDPQQPLRYHRAPLDARLSDAPDMMQILALYQETLKDLGLEGLGLQPVGHPSGREFVGSQRCADCHSTAYSIWEGTPHAHATDSIAHPNERVEIPRHFDPECLSCHVTGWSPQGYYPYLSGYLSLEKTPHLVANGCENCHGPGSAHVAAESGEVDADEATLLSLRNEMRLPLADARKKCVECHDHDNSPDFHVPGAFEHYWEQVEHRGKD